MTDYEYANYYLSRGFSIIPLKRQDKKPALQSWKPYQEKAPTEDELHRWFGNGSGHNMGIVTGKVSGIVVVDLDSKKAEEYSKDHNFPKTPTVKTGKGYHLYFKYREGVIQTRTRPKGANN